MNLIIVESPTKARTFNRYLKGEDYFVFATMGHIRDLPENDLAVDYSNNFFPRYQIIKNKEKIVKALQNLGERNNQIILATDLDREGESIAYHTAYLLGFIEENWPDFKIRENKNKKLSRIIFHEITPSAIKSALQNPIQLRKNLIKAQQARRILDRIVGYELSPLLWKKIGKNWLSAGRVQTVALRLIVEREKEIENFQQKEFYDIYGYFNKSGNNDLDNHIKAKLIKKDEIDIYQKETLKLFAGEYSFSYSIIDEKELESIKNQLIEDNFIVKNIEEKIEKSFPPPPFITSSLQQEAFYHFGFSSKLTMKLAQDLYENGLITYHRTDSFNISSGFIFKARDYIKNNFGENYLSETIRSYKTKSKLAQEAHEAIRPTTLTEKINFKSIRHKKLYQLIFNRSIATQMKEAYYKVFEIEIKSDKNFIFKSIIKELDFDGFLRILNPKIKNKKTNLSIKKGDKLFLIKLEDKKNYTSPPPRYNDATLIKVLEEKGIGRPSTYAAILSLIQEKYYVEKNNRYFIPTQLGKSISDYLSRSFSEIFDLNFTANLENQLDNIADGKAEFIFTISNFFQKFKKILENEKKNKETINVEEKINEKCPLCRGDLIIRYSKFGKFIACNNFPQCKFTKPFLNFIKDKVCPRCGGRIVVKLTKTKKKFYSCENYPKCNYAVWKLKTD